MNSNKIINSAKKTLTTEIKGIKTLSKIFNKNFYNAVKTLFNAKGKVIVTGIGKSAHIGNKIASTLSSTGTPSYFIHATEASHGDLGTIKKNDCILAISNSGETSELINIINYSKRFNIPLISISGNAKSVLYKKSTFGILYQKPVEACPLNLAPTTSTTMTLIIGDCIAISLLELRGFKSNQFKNLHPGGNLGKDLTSISDIMHKKPELPLAKANESVSSALLTMTKKSFGCVGVINKSKKLVGIITDGDLRRMLQNQDNIQNIFAKDLMTTLPKTIEKGDLAYEAFSILKKNNITQLLVTHESEYVGIIHLHDILKHNLF